MSDLPTSTLDDESDAGIVRAVSNDARATLADLSAAVGLSVSAVQTRLRRLETRGVITGYRALVDAEAVGKPLAAFVEITPLDPAQPDNAPELLEHLAEIEACHSIAGQANKVAIPAMVTVASDPAIHEFVRLEACKDLAQEKLKPGQKKIVRNALTQLAALKAVRKGEVEGVSVAEIEGLLRKF